MTVAEKKKQFNKILLGWHKAHYRDMPWRNTRDPYRILVSEIMLQQTQVDRVRIKYPEFLSKFPSVGALARATLGDVLRVWSGLGYNRRAKYLHTCAKMIMSEHRGEFPRDFDALMELSGIGRSTAAALLAFSFDKDLPMIDTNIRRILVRTFFTQKKAARTAIPSDIQLFAFGNDIIPKGKGRAWNYAMLDLGATVCTARNHPTKCPLNALHGKVGDFVYKKPQKKFLGSRRYYRGQALRLLASEHKLTVLQLAKKTSSKTEFARDILEQLFCEGMLVRHGRSYRLS